MEVKKDAPIAKKIPFEITAHGHTRIDNYYWLNERENPEVIQYLEDENAFTKSMMEDTRELQDTLFNEITGRIKKTDASAPYFENGYYYYVRYTEKNEYPVYCRKKESLDNAEEILLDANHMAKGHDYFQVSGITISPDNEWAAYGTDTVGRRLFVLHFKNLKTGKILSHTINNTTGKATWANDSQTIFYTEKDLQTLRPHKIQKCAYDGSSAVENVYTELDETYNSGVFKSRSKKYILIYSDSTNTTEFRYLDANKPDGEMKIFLPREKNHEYAISHHGDYFYIRTNWKAQNFRLMRTNTNNTDKSQWEEVIPHRTEVLLESFQTFESYLCLEERTNGQTKIRVMETTDDKQEHYIEFPEDAYTVWIDNNPETRTNLLRIQYTSLTTPISTFDYNMQDRAFNLVKQQEVLGNFNKDDYASERLFIEARDGAKVPVSLVYKKGMEKDSTNPLLLYGYGSYGHTVDPYFSSVRLSLLNRGFIFAIAHVRGGQMMGRHWYEDGRLLKKKNTFFDFIDCAEYLIQAKYTNQNVLFAMGGSAGGLLMGTVINLRPWLFKGVIAAVPFVDVVTTMLDTSIPLTTSEYDEWGNPENKEYYDYILSYSPYDNIEMKSYPALLVTAGLHDSQVQYWEPAKWVAKLRDMNTGSNMILLHTNMDTGHSGASGRFERFKETALEYAFLLKLLDT